MILVLPLEADWHRAGCVDNMQDVLLSILFFVILASVDWALVDGFRRSLLAFRDIPEYYNYRRFMFPRIFVILLSSIILYYSSQTDAFGNKGFVFSISAIVVFFMSSLYPQIVMLLRSKAY